MWVKEHPKIEAWFDGVCEPRNPGGHAAWGIRICVDGEEIHTEGGYVGCSTEMSNNVAEYCGVCAVMRWVCASGLTGALTIRGDSKLVISQLSKRWRVNGGLYYPYYLKAVDLLGTLRRKIGVEVVFQWIPRQQNSDCDYYSKKVLRDRGVRFRIQPLVRLEKIVGGVLY